MADGHAVVIRGLGWQWGCVMHKRPWFYPLWALVAFWAWAFHVATGFLNGLIGAHSGRRSAIIGMLDSFTNGALVEPLEIGRASCRERVLVAV